MIVSKTPFRMSFFGGGTDYPTWFLKHGGATLSTTIDKYLYISCSELPPFFESKHRIVWSKFEVVDAIEDIQHPAIREGLKFMGFDDRVGLDIHYQAELPGLSGMGSSSTFAVGLINALSAFKGEIKTAHDLARSAIHLEAGILQEHVGVQDQLAAAYGGVNRMEFDTNGSFRVAPIGMSTARQNELEGHIVLIFTGLTRYAFEVARSVVENIPNKERALLRLREMVDEACDILTSDVPIEDFGLLLDEAWNLKRTLSDDVSNSEIDALYAEAREHGAIGGKLLGAGGGGFLMLFVPPAAQPALKEHFKDRLQIPIAFSGQGSRIMEL